MFKLKQKLHYVVTSVWLPQISLMRSLLCTLIWNNHLLFHLFCINWNFSQFYKSLFVRDLDCCSKINKHLVDLGAKKIPMVGRVLDCHLDTSPYYSILISPMNVTFLLFIRYWEHPACYKKVIAQ